MYHVAADLPVTIYMFSIYHVEGVNIISLIQLETLIVKICLYLKKKYRVLSSNDFMHFLDI